MNPHDIADPLTVVPPNPPRLAGAPGPWTAAISTPAGSDFPCRSSLAHFTGFPSSSRFHTRRGVSPRAFLPLGTHPGLSGR